MNQEHMILFNTLEYAKKLKEAGFTEAQAEAQTEGIAQILESNVATKHDIGDVKHDIEQLRAELKRDIADVERDIEQLRAELKHDIEQLRAELKRDIADVKRDIEQLRAELKRDIAELGMKLTIRLGGMLVVAVGILAAMKFFG